MEVEDQTGIDVALLDPLEGLVDLLEVPHE
jgi:hypothetical protein